MASYTHYAMFPGTDRVDLVAGDVSGCLGCGVYIFSRWRYPHRENDPYAIDEPDLVWWHIAQGRIELPEGAEPVDEGTRLCESCGITVDGLLTGAV